MNRTSLSWYRDERARLSERAAELDTRIADLHAKLTDAIRERALVDDLTLRLSHHIPETDYEIVDESPALSIGAPLPRAAAGGER